MYIKNECYLYFAINRSDIRLCNKIEDKERGGPKRSECISSIAEKTRDISLCFKLENLNNMESCIKKVAYVTKDPNLCELISSVESKHHGNIPRNECYLHIAIELKNTSICDRIEYTDDMDLVEETLSKRRECYHTIE